MRNVLARVSKSAQAMVAATVRTIFGQPDRAAAAAQLRHVCDILAPRFPAVVQLLEKAESEVLTFYDFPVEHRRQVYSSNPLERLNKELKRRSALVGQHRCFSEASRANILNPKEEETAAPLPAQAAAA